MERECLIVGVAGAGELDDVDEAVPPIRMERLHARTDVIGAHGGAPAVHAHPRGCSEQGEGKNPGQPAERLRQLERPVAHGEQQHRPAEDGGEDKRQSEYNPPLEAAAQP